MKGDFTRSTFRAGHHYSAVRMQQGRVQVDADWNEQADIVAHRERATARDLVGESGAPYPGTPGAFEHFQLRALGAGTDLEIAPGRYYVRGILCENDAVTRYTAQEDYPGATLPTDAGANYYMAYLEVWERDISAVEHPPLLEPALGGPDTAVRSRIVWQVKLERLAITAPPESCGVLMPWAPANSESGGRLRARAEEPTGTPGRCEVPPGAGYRGLENQLYRVEIHTGGPPASATYKWSRENGSVLAGVRAINGTRITLDAATRDRVHGFGGGDWIELTSEERTLVNSGTRRPVLARLQEVQGQVLTVTSWPGGTPDLATFGKRPVVRRWEGTGDVSTSAGTWIHLEDGVHVQFDLAASARYQPGDHWLIPARSLTGTVEWPRDPGSGGTTTPRWELRHGTERRFAPLAVVHKDGAGAWSVVRDCRSLFPAATERASLFYLSGDGQAVMPVAGTALVRLPVPLRVGVGTGKHPVPERRVRFELVLPPGAQSGTTLGGRLVAVADSANAGQTIELFTSSAGTAECWWEVDGNLVDQARAPQVRATLLTDVGTTKVVTHLPVTFSVTLSTAATVQYDPTNAGLPPAINTVQEAIDLLAESGENTPGITIVDVQRIADGQSVDNDTPLTADLLAGGLRIRCAPGSVLDPATLTGKPTCTVTVDVPYPLSDADQLLWATGATPSPVFGTHPITLAGQLSVAQDRDIEWRPAPAADAWLRTVLFRVLRARRISGSLLGRLTLLGNFVHDVTPAGELPRHVDGDVYGRRATDGHIGIDLDDANPSGDRRRGGDFRMWFWVNPPRRPGIKVFTIVPEVLMMQPASARTATGTIELTAPVVTESVVIDVTIPAAVSGLVSVSPSRLVLEPGASRATFGITLLSNPAADTAITLSAAIQGAQEKPSTFTVTARRVQAAVVAGLSFDRAVITPDPRGPNSATLTVTLDREAVEATTIALAEASAYLGLSAASIAIPVGNSSGTAMVTAEGDPSTDVTATVTANAAGQAPVSGTITVQRRDARVATVKVSPSTISARGGTVDEPEPGIDGTASVTLDRAAPPAGTDVHLSFSENGTATLPFASFKVGAQLQQTLTLTVPSGDTSVSVTVVARRGLRTGTKNVKIHAIDDLQTSVSTVVAIAQIFWDIDVDRDRDWNDPTGPVVP